MMDLLRVAYGSDRILGKKFPQEEKLKKIQEKQSKETEDQYNARMYLFSQMSEKRNLEKQINYLKDMNPNGFWESLYTVQGCKYNFLDYDNLNSLLHEKSKSICKIVSQGLIKSDPQYIDKIIMMIRHPRAIAKSQEKLIRPSPLGDLSQITIDGKEIKIHTPEMFIHVTCLVTQWLIKFNHVPVYNVIYDDLIESPEETLRGVEEFLGEKGNFEDAIKQIDKTLKRSLPENIENSLWDEAEFIYDCFINKDYQSIIDFYERNDTATYQKSLSFTCLRSGNQVQDSLCKLCRKNDEKFIENQIKTAGRRDIDWENQPCIYECGYNLGYKSLTIQESIENNFWKENINPINIPEDSILDAIIDNGERNMAENIIFNKNIIQLIIDNIDIFKYEYPNIKDKTWKLFLEKKGGCSCTKSIIKEFKSDIEKINSILSELLNQKVNLNFYGPLKNPIVKEFPSLSEMELFLKELKSKGTHIQSATPSPNGQGGYIMVIM